ncbi:MAG: transcriptional regulator, MarR family [Pedosphaera sp.]|nr:transcriptional regulator, MarR family [Pedosphaera sp.]
MRHKYDVVTAELLKEAAKNCLCFNARKAARAVTRFYDRHFAGTGVEPTQFNILVALRLSQPVALAHLAGHLGLERTTFTRNLHLLQRNGLVEVQRGEDARERLLSLSAAGERALEEAIPHWQRAQQAAISALGGDGFARLSEALSLSAKFTSNNTLRRKKL